MSQGIAQRETAHSSAVVTAASQPSAGKIAPGLQRLHPSWFVFVVGLMMLGACADGVTETNATSYGQGPFWQGGICFTRTRSGQMVRVAPSNCPLQAETEAPADGTTTSN